MIRKCDTHRPQTNQKQRAMRRHKTQSHDSKNTIKVKQSALSLSVTKDAQKWEQH